MKVRKPSKSFQALLATYTSFVGGDLVHLVDKQGSDNPKHQAGNQLHDDAVEPEVDGEHAVRVHPSGLRKGNMNQRIFKHDLPQTHTRAEMWSSSLCVCSSVRQTHLGLSGREGSLGGKRSTEDKWENGKGWCTRCFQKIW